MRKKKVTEENKIEVINLGLKGFQESVRMQQIPCTHVNWQPPAGGDPELIAVLDHLKEYL